MLSKNTDANDAYAEYLEMLAKSNDLLDATKASLKTGFVTCLWFFDVITKDELLLELELIRCELGISD